MFNYDPDLDPLPRDGDRDDQFEMSQPFSSARPPHGVGRGGRMGGGRGSFSAAAGQQRRPAPKPSFLSRVASGDASALLGSDGGDKEDDYDEDEDEDDDDDDDVGSLAFQRA